MAVASSGRAARSLLMYLHSTALILVYVLMRRGNKLCGSARAHVRVRTYLEETFEHDVYDLVLLIDVVQLHQILERVELIFPLGLEQPLVWRAG